MSDKPPRHIVCAVRSRPGGEETVSRAIELALATSARLTFCQIVDIGFVNRFSSRGSSRKTAEQELVDMAEFALIILQDRARQQGVSEVDYVVRTGPVREELLRVVRQSGADLLVLGRPKPMPGRSTFDSRRLEQLVAELEEAGVEVNY